MTAYMIFTLALLVRDQTLVVIRSADRNEGLSADTDLRDRRKFPTHLCRLAASRSCFGFWGAGRGAVPGKTTIGRSGCCICEPADVIRRPRGSLTRSIAAAGRRSHRLVVGNAGHRFPRRGIHRTSIPGIDTLMVFVPFACSGVVFA